MSLKRLCGAAAMLLLAGTASAQGTWSLVSSSCPVSGSLGASQSNCQGSGGSVTATMTAWGNTGSGTNFVRYELDTNDPNGFGAKQLNGAGTALSETTSPYHAFDNISSSSNGSTGTQEFLLIQFSQRVNLTQMTIGWWNADADASIYRYDGTLTSGVISGSTLGSDWKLVSSEDVNGTDTYQNGDTATFNVNDASAVSGGNGTDRYSSWWLISTYAGTSTANSLDTNKDDAFKIQSLVANVCLGGTTTGNGSVCTPNNNGSVPEPGSFALAGLALIGAAATRRKFKRKG